MREYLLYSQIPAIREHQVLGILAGLTGTQPVPIYEQTLVFGQLKVPEAAASKRAATKQQQKPPPPPSYHKLTRAVSLNSDDATEVDPWTFRVEAVPEPGVTDFISRDVSERLATDEDINRLQQADLYRTKRQYAIKGNRFVSNNVIIKVYRFFASPATADPISSPPPSSNALTLIDASGSWVVEAAVRIGETNSSNLLDQAKKELLTFRDTIDGAVQLIAPDRLALDTRVKGLA